MPSVHPSQRQACAPRRQSHLPGWGLASIVLSCGTEERFLYGVGWALGGPADPDEHALIDEAPDFREDGTLFIRRHGG